MPRLAVLIVLLSVSASWAQWRNVAPNLLTASSAFNGAVYFRDGILWAGVSELWSSADTGATWQQVPFSGSLQIRDIYFLDRNNGLVATGDAGAFLTRDGGTTWENIAFGEIAQVAFGSSPNIIYVLEHNSGTLYKSTDGALSFIGESFTGQANALSIARNGTIRVLCYTFNYSLLSESSDGGATWVKDIQSADADCWSLAVDSCDPDRLYRLNEDWAWTIDNVSEILLSFDAGRSWTATANRSVKYFAGGLATTENTIVASTVNGNGVHFSTDRGITWTDIGGPSVGRDTRAIALVDDSIVVVLDNQGSVWVRLPLGKPVPKSLFATDTVTACDSSVTRTYARNLGGCSLKSIVGAQVIGATGYTIENVTQDSVRLTFTHTLPEGSKDALLVLTFSNGSRDTIHLLGNAKGSRHQVQMVTQDLSIDTLGGLAEVPLVLRDFDQAHDIELTVHYEPADKLQYRGSYHLTNGARLDIAGEEFPGRSKLRIPNVSNAVVAYATFDVFADSGDAPKVWFDSLVVLTAKPCEYSTLSPIVSFITPPAGCGIDMIAQLLRTGGLDLSIHPNPADKTIAIRTNRDLSNAQLIISDALGKEVRSVMVALQTSTPFSLDISTLSPGMYFLRLSAGTDLATVAFAVDR